MVNAALSKSAIHRMRTSLVQTTIGSAVGAWNESEDEKSSNRICTIGGLHHKPCEKLHYLNPIEHVFAWLLWINRYGGCNANAIYMNEIVKYSRIILAQSIATMWWKIGRSPVAKDTVALRWPHGIEMAQFVHTVNASNSIVLCAMSNFPALAFIV